MRIIREFLSKIYSFFPKNRSRALKELHNEIAEEVIRRISSGRLLDAGAGPGYLPIEIAKRTKNLEILGIDVSPAVVEIATNNARTSGFSENIHFQVANIANLPFKDGYFDLVVSTFSINDWVNPMACLQEIYRVLKDNGEAWIYDARRDITKETNRQLRDKYGWIYFLSINLKRLLFCMTLKEIEDVCGSAIGFSAKNIEDKGAVLKLRLLKLAKA